MVERARDEEYREAILDAFTENGGKLKKSEGIEMLKQRFSLSEAEAEAVLQRYIDFNGSETAKLSEKWEKKLEPGDQGSDGRPGASASDADRPAPSESREVIKDAFNTNGKLHRDRGIKLLEETFDLDREAAIDELERYVNFNDAGWTHSIEQTSFAGDISSLNQYPGFETDRTWNGLPILEAEEGNEHPLIPDQDVYLDRVVEGQTTDAEVLAKAMADPDFSPLLVGDAGTGKDTLVRYVCAKTNRPCVRVNFGEDVRYADLVGTRMPAGNDDGEGIDIVWEDGILTHAVKYGYVFIADEINAAPPEATMPLHQVTEEGDDAELVIREESRIVTPHPQFRFVATMNPPRGGYGGVEQLNDAFKSRFYTIEVDYLEPEDEAKLLRERFEDDAIDVTDSEITQLTELAAGFREQYQRGDIVTPVTTRELIKVCKMSDIMSMKQAARMVIGGHAKENDERLIIDRINTELSS